MVRNIIRRQIQMSKLEDNVNEILGIEKKTEVAVKDFEQPAPVPRKIDETNISKTRFRPKKSGNTFREKKLGVLTQTFLT